MRFLALLLPAILVIAYFASQSPDSNPASSPAAAVPRVLAAVVSEPVKLKRKRHRTEPALTADGANLIAAYILAGGAAGGGLPFPLLPR